MIATYNYFRKMHDILQSLFFFLPAMLANSAASVSSKIYPLSKWKYPMDFGCKIGGVRIFGSHKTIRGFVVGIIFASIGGLLQYYLISNRNIVINWTIYGKITSSLILSLLLGVGALLGDAVKSFFKRRVGIKPGKPWLPFDWIDYSLGSMFFSYFYFFPGYIVYFYFLFMALLLSPLSNIVSKIIGLKEGYL